jgi:glycosyltransferase involved in cell wall biosynthesis
MQIDVASTCGGKRLSAQSNLDRPLITIVTVVLNGNNDLESCILSVLRQKCDNLEYIILDGGSTDGTLDILRKYENSIDYWVSEPDRGIYDAMNKAVYLARGRWVYFLGCDDTLCDSLASVADCLKDEQTIYYGNAFMTGTQHVYDGEFGAWKLSRRNICHQAIFYPRSVLELWQFNLKYPVLADWELNIRCYSNPHYRFQHIPITVANYNNVSGNSSIRRDYQFEKDRGNIIRDCLPLTCYVWYRIYEFARAVYRRLKGRR